MGHISDLVHTRSQISICHSSRNRLGFVGVLTLSLTLYVGINCGRTVPARVKSGIWTRTWD